MLPPLEERYPDRTIVRLKDGRHVALPVCYSGKAGQKAWAKLSSDQQGFVISALTSFEFFTHYVFLPYQSQIDREVWPHRLPWHWSEFCRDVEITLPAELCPFDKKTREDGIYCLERAWPTGTGKTTLAVRALPLYLICIDNNTTCLLGTSTVTLGERHVANHRLHLTSNSILIHCFGIMHHVDSTKTWKANKICVDGKLDEASGNVEVFGYGGEVEGTRFDVGITDDVVTKETVKTETSRDNVWNWMNVAFYSRLHPHRRIWVNIGTVHHANDAHCRIIREAESKGTWDVKVYRMVRDDEQGCPWPPQLKDPSLGYRMDNVVIDPLLKDYLLWPEFWTPEKVVQDYVANPHAFALTRQNRPRDPESKLFQREVLEAYCRADGGLRPDGSLRPLLSCWRVSEGIPQPGSVVYQQYREAGIDIQRRVIAIDPAATVKRAGTEPDYTVLELWGLDAHSKARILLDLYRFRTQSPKQLKSVLSRWLTAYRPHYLVFETNAMARWSAVDIQESLGVPVVKSELRGTKVEEIEALRDLAESSLLYYPWAQDGYTRQRVQIFEDELVGYPDEAPHDDTLMCAVHAMRKLSPGDLDGVRVHLLGARQETEQQLAYEAHYKPCPPPTREEEWLDVMRKARAEVGMTL